MLWLVLGYAAVGAGAVGVVTPLVPTTPFLILAAFAFARSSPRLEQWLLDHPRFGLAIKNWRRHRAIGRRAKIWSLAAMASTVGLSVLFGVGANLLLVQGVVLGAAALFVVSRPSGPPSSGKADLCD